MKTKKKILITGIVCFGGGIAVTLICHEWLADNIPYSYRQNPLDIIDYISGRNVFNRKNSLQ